MYLLGPSPVGQACDRLLDLERDERRRVDVLEVRRYGRGTVAHCYCIRRWVNSMVLFKLHTSATLHVQARSRQYVKVSERGEREGTVVDASYLYLSLS